VFGRECAFCGRDVRGLPDARKEGRVWFCTPSHQLSYGQWGRSRSAGGMWKPFRVAGKAIK